MDSAAAGSGPVASASGRRTLPAGSKQIRKLAYVVDQDSGDSQEPGPSTGKADQKRGAGQTTASWLSEPGPRDNASTCSAPFSARSCPLWPRAEREDVLSVYTVRSRGDLH